MASDLYKRVTQHDAERDAGKKRQPVPGEKRTSTGRAHQSSTKSPVHPQRPGASALAQGRTTLKRVREKVADIRTSIATARERREKEAERKAVHSKPAATSISDPVMAGTAARDAELKRKGQERLAQVKKDAEARRATSANPPRTQVAATTMPAGKGAVSAGAYQGAKERQVQQGKNLGTLGGLIAGATNYVRRTAAANQKLYEDTVKAAEAKKGGGTPSATAGETSSVGPPGRRGRFDPGTSKPAKAAAPKPGGTTRAAPTRTSSAPKVTPPAPPSKPAQAAQPIARPNQDKGATLRAQGEKVKAEMAARRDANKPGPGGGASQVLAFYRGEKTHFPKRESNR